LGGRPGFFFAGAARSASAAAISWALVLVLDGTAETFFKGVADFGGSLLTGASGRLALMDMVGFPGFSTLIR
jgi:hypothetical protein